MSDEAKRKDLLPIKVYCLPEERRYLQDMAEATGLSLSVYLRRVGMGYEVNSILDHQRVLDLAKVNGDLGRLGGLLKLWLIDDKRLAGLPPSMIRTLLAKLDSLQEELRDIMTRVVR